MKKSALFIAGVVGFMMSYGQTEKYIPLPENMILQGVSSIDAHLPDTVRSYTEFRSASLVAWHPIKRNMLITTRFGNTNQLHEVGIAKGMRKQLTFFEEPVRSAYYQPVQGDYFIYSRDMGGNEFAQLFRYDMNTGKSTLLTDGGKSQNGGVVFNKAGSQILYTSTRRNGTDRDVYIMNPMQPSSNKLLIELEGGGWNVVDWKADNNHVLLSKYVSANESSVWEFSISTKKLSRIIPLKDERVIYTPLAYTKDSNAIFLMTDAKSEFAQPVRFNRNSGKMDFLVTDNKGQITQYKLTENQQYAAYVVNESGVFNLYIQYLATKQSEPIAGLPSGIVGGLHWRKDNQTLGFSYSSSQAAGDVMVFDRVKKKVVRWTESELGGMNLSALPIPKLISWKSFDGLSISGFLYKAPARFIGKRPVIINIHGGPEGQSVPGFIARSNYYLNEMGICIIYPNVRGSSGFGKTFLDLDNGIKRENSVKDIGALLDWIEKQPDLDANRIMITGGSYGGYMTLASAFHYNDRIKCALDVVGISHFTTFLKNTESYRQDLRRVEYGDERDEEMAKFFDEIAPLNNAHKITKPMFIVQGKNDPRVPYTEAEQMVQKIKANGGVVWYMMANDEGHGFAKKNNQDYQFYATIAFIREYLLK
ncbi:MAG: S9 family peptidase [Ferruginibacter sp.]|nr:S9 family peptidase [Ferruginibacter sp.]